MLEPTRKPLTNTALTFIGPAEMQEKAIEVMKTIGFTPAERSWRLAFPEFADNEQGTVLRGARLKKDLTQKQLAEKTGIPQRHISELETGKRQIGKNRAKTLADALQVSDYRVFL